MELLAFLNVSKLSNVPGLGQEWVTAEETMNGIIYIVGLIVIILAILSALGLR